MKRYIFAIVVIFFGGNLFAQNATDAFRYSQTTPTGTARYTGMAGAMGGFGSDFTVLSANNPAGIGLFKRFEITVTPAVEHMLSKGTYNDSSLHGRKFNFVNNNFGVVMPWRLSTGKWKAVQVGLGINTLARYNSNVLILGKNTGRDGQNTNFMDYLVAQSNGLYPQDLENNQESVLGNLMFNAYYYYLIDTLPGATQYRNLVHDNASQDFRLTNSGYMNEFVMSVGTNYDDKIYLGLTVGIPYFRYSQDLEYYENTQGVITSYRGLEYQSSFTSRATGVNLKFGLLYQPVRWVRLGAAFHTPTLYSSVTEHYNSSYFINGLIEGDSLPLRYIRKDDNNTTNISKYQLITPYHVIANVAFMSGKIGFIDLDYQFTDYSSMNMQHTGKTASDAGYFREQNESIRSYFRGVHTVKLGGELSVLNPFLIRLGAAYSTNPYDKSLKEKDGSALTFSGGVGLRFKFFFVDFAYSYRIQKDKSVFYDAGTLNPYAVDYRHSIFALTIGCKLGR